MSSAAMPQPQSVFPAERLLRIRDVCHFTGLAAYGRDEAIGHGILDADGLAQWLGCTRKHLSQSLLMRPDFPPPFLYASRRIRWWRSSDVQTWCKDKGSVEIAAPLARSHAVEGV